MKFSYLIIDILAVAIPLLFSFHRKIKFTSSFREYFLANLMSAVVFVIWDIIFTWRGVWGFNPRYILGVKFLGLPIEEFLFFICIPFSCVFTHFCLTRFWRSFYKVKAGRLQNLIISLALLTVGIIFISKSYTAVTFISTSLFIFFAGVVMRKTWLSQAYQTYLILLVPFFIINGILTGSGIAEPIVWYNNNETIGIRILTIPIEDILYGFELFILTLSFYSLFHTTWSKKDDTKPLSQTSFTAITEQR